MSLLIVIDSGPNLSPKTFFFALGQNRMIEKRCLQEYLFFQTRIEHFQLAT